VPVGVVEDDLTSISDSSKVDYKQLVTELLSGLVNGLLMFVFCYVFASLVFGEVGLDDSVPLGAGTNTISAFVVGLSFALYSDCPVSIAGPDINPTIFFAQMSVKIREYVDSHYSEDDNRDARVLTTTLLSIMIGSGVTGLWFYLLGRFKLTRIVQFVPAAVLSGFLAAVGVIIMVKAVKASVGNELSHHLDYWQFWVLLAPAVPIGVLLYLSKRFHISTPIVMIPLCLFGPFTLFYIISYGLGNDLNGVREYDLCQGKNFSCSYLYEEYPAVSLVEQWQNSYGSFHLVEWYALVDVIPDYIVMLIIVSLDSLLKISGTKKNLKFNDLDYDHEMQLAGKANMALIFCVGTPGYGQLKFNALNSGIIHNTSSRLPGIVAALFNGGLFFAGFPLINFLPRFFVGAMLIYAGMGFVVENLIDTWTQNRLSLFEYVTVVAIVVLSQAFSILMAVLVGVMLSFVLFVIQYSKTGVIKAVLSGKDFQSSVIRSTQEDAKLEHLSSQVVIIKLKRYIFFGSANQISDLVGDILEEASYDPQDIKALDEMASLHPDEVDAEEAALLDESYESRSRVNTLVFDFEDVYGIDFTACGILGELISQIVESNEMALRAEQDSQHTVHLPSPSQQTPVAGALRHIFARNMKKQRAPSLCTIIFTGMSSKVYRRLKTEGIIDMIHLSGHERSDLDAVREVMPNISSVARTRKVAAYIANFLGRKPKTNVSHSSKDNYGDSTPLSAIHDMDEDVIDVDRFESEDPATGFLAGEQEVNQGPRPATTSDYYNSLDFPNEYRRVFPTLDFAMEWVEERLLERASMIRQKWLVFCESFQILHEQARLKAQHEPFEHILGGHLGDTVWKYVQPIRVPMGAYLCTAGEINPHLFLLQHGRLTSYMVRQDDTLIRLQSHHRGAFINADALFVEYPLSHTVIADEDSVVLALSRENLKELEAHSPEVAFEIHRDVLRHTARVRNRLARELDVVDHWALHERLARSGERDNNAKEFSSFHHGWTHDHRSEVSTPPGSSFHSSSGLGINAISSAMQHFSGFSSSYASKSDNQTVSEYAPSSITARSRPSAMDMSEVSITSKPITPATPLAVPEKHLTSTSKSVGRVIMNQAHIELKEKAAADAEGAATNAISANDGEKSEGTINADDETEPGTTRSPSTSLSGMYSVGYATSANFGRSSSHSQTLARSKSSENLPDDHHMRRKKALRVLTHYELSAGSTSALPGIGSARSGHHNTSVADIFHRERNLSGYSSNDDARSQHSILDPMRLSRSSALCFRPDLQPDFLRAHLPITDDLAAKIEPLVDPELTRSHLQLSQLQRMDAIACFQRAVSNKFHGRGKAPPSRSSTEPADASALSPTASNAENLIALFSNALPISRLKPTLMDMGHYPSDSELNDILAAHNCSGASEITEEIFLKIVCDLSLEPLSDSHIQGFALFFTRHATKLEGDDSLFKSREGLVFPDQILTVEGLHELLVDLEHPEDPYRLEKMFREWSDASLPGGNGRKPIRVLNFVSLCSMMAYHIKSERLDEQVAEDFKTLTQDKMLDDIITVSDIVEANRTRGLPCSRLEAEDMVFEADMSSNGGVSYDDLVSTLTTVFSSEIEPQLEQLTENFIEADRTGSGSQHNSASVYP